MLDLSSSPLLATRRDSARFVGRQHEVKKLLEAVSHDYNVAVFGSRGSGKTSILHFVEYQLREQRRVVFVDSSVVSDAARFLQLVSYRLGLAPSPAEDVRETFSALFRPQRPRSELGEVLVHLEALRSDGENQDDDPPTTVIVDDLDAAVAHTVFGRLRNELWSLPYRWVVAGDVDARTAFLTPPADSFFDVVLELGPLSEEELIAALHARADARDDAVDTALAHQLAEIADGNPRRLFAAAREALLGGAEANDLKSARARQLNRLARVSESAQTLFAELEARGQASAADEELLRGWSRQRVRRAFDELEAAGLVVAQSEVRQRPGRPRKVYSVESAVSA